LDFPAGEIAGIALAGVWDRRRPGHGAGDLGVREYGALMRRRPVAVTVPGSLEYPRPVMPAGLSEDQQDELLDQMMGTLLTGGPEAQRKVPGAIEGRVGSAEDWPLGDDVVEF
jgi:hypothetical protein